MNDKFRLDNMQYWDYQDDGNPDGIDEMMKVMAEVNRMEERNTSLVEIVKTMNQSGEIEITIPTVPLSRLINKSKRRKSVWVSKNDIKKASEMDDATFEEYWQKAKQYNYKHRNYEFGKDVGGNEIVTMGKRRTSVKEFLEQNDNEPVNMESVYDMHLKGAINAEMISESVKSDISYLFEDEIADTELMMNGVVIDSRWVEGALNINVNVNGQTMLFRLTPEQSEMLTYAVSGLQDNANMLVQKTVFFMPDYSQGPNNVRMKEIVVKQ